MSLGSLFHSSASLAVFAALIFVCSLTEAQEKVAPTIPSDPVALALVQELLDSFGNDVYHCKWEYDAERTGEPNFRNGTNKLHIEGEWSFSAKFGSSYTIKYGGVEYIIREVEGGGNKIISFWPEVKDDGQKFRMNVSMDFNNAFRGDIGGLRLMFYPCVVRSHLLMDKWGNPSIFGLKSFESENAVISFLPLNKSHDHQFTLQTKGGAQITKETWRITDADPNTYKIYQGAEAERIYSNVRVNMAWLPSEISYKQRLEQGLLGSKSVFETARWKVIGQYTVNTDTSKFKDIVPPNGTLLFDEQTKAPQRIGGGVGTWQTTDKMDKNAQENALVKELQQLPDKPAKATISWYPTGRLNLYFIVGAVLLVGILAIAVIKTNVFGLRSRA